MAEAFNPAQLGLDRKAELCSGVGMWNLEAVPEANLQSIYVTDGPHGVRKQDTDGDSFLSAIPATCFPTAAGLAASWDPQLLHQIGVAIGAEARSQGVSVILGPGANIKRHPLGGRNFEYFSEDPHLTGELAAGMITGLQSAGVGASLKHFAVNNQETRRMVLDVIVDERALHEIYLAGFETAVRKGEPRTVMCAYNLINGVPCSDNRWLLTEVLRDEWGFDGVVVTDWGAMNDRVAALTSGLDLEMPGGKGPNDALIAAAVRDGAITEEAVDTAVGRIVELIEESSDVESSPPLDSDANHDLARRAAAESAVLLTNRGLLPLDPRANIAVIGAFATDPRYQGAGSSQVTPTRVDAPLAAIRKAISDGCESRFGLQGHDAGSARYAAGYEAQNDTLRPDLIESAVEVAKRASAVVLFAGLPRPYESEGFDRDHGHLPRQHNSLISAVCAANPNTVVVLSNGAPIQMPWVDEPAAIVEAYLGGQALGSAIADVLFGEVNPCAKLAETFPLDPADVLADPWFPGVGRQVEYREGVYVGYRWSETVGADVLFPFGHGLSYTSFEYSALRLSAETIDMSGSDEVLEISVTLANTGQRRGSEVVQVYVRAPGSVIDRPDRELRGFDKVPLMPGESRLVEFTLDERAFSFYDTARGSWRVESGEYEILVGASSRDIRQRATVRVESGFEGSADGNSVQATDRPSRDSIADDGSFEERLGHSIPVARRTRPFHRDSTIEDLCQVWIGRRFRQLVEWQSARQFGEADEALLAMLKHGTAEAPLRVISQLSGGDLSIANVDRLVWLCNHWPSLRSRSQT